MIEIEFNPTFSSFLNKYSDVIMEVFTVVSKYKKYCPNTFKYSPKYKPRRSHYKYTDKLFIGCIIYIIMNNCSWNSFIGPIPGKQVHKKFMEYSKNDVFNSLFNNSIKEYIKQIPNNVINVISVDSTFIQNRYCKDIIHRNPQNKNKRSSKISAIVDTKGIPLSITINDSNKHDSTLFTEVFNKLVDDGFPNNGVTLLADKGYDTKGIRENIKSNNMVPIIGYNKRNTKDVNKIKSLTDSEKELYKRRIKVEHFFGSMKKYPKINMIYEKTLESYRNMVLLISSLMVIRKMIT